MPKIFYDLRRKVMLPFSILSMGGGALGITTSLLLVAIIMALWVLALIILHPVHAVIFVIAAGIEYFIYNFFFLDIWQYILIFFAIYLVLFGIYRFAIRRLIPLPKNKIDYLIKLSELYDLEKIDEEEFKAAKKVLLKL
jgi:hypothetical protein